MGIIFETSLGVFLLVTVFLGGGAAYMAGRAVAMTWGSLGHLVVYAGLLLLAGLGFRLTRGRMWVVLFGGLFVGPVPLTWRERPTAARPEN